MTLTSKDVVATARQLVGVPFQHQGRGAVGLDCVGLLIAVGKRLGIAEHWREQPYRNFPSESMVRSVLDQHLDPWAGDPAPGCVALIRWRLTANHLGIVTDSDEPFALVHAYHQYGRVVEHRADGIWRARIVGLYQFRGVTL